MSVKYTIPFRDDANILWRVDIDLPNYAGDSLELVGVGRTFCVLNYGAQNEDPFEAIINSNLTLSFYNRNGEVDIRELQLLGDLEGRVRLYRDDEMYWSGFIIPDGIQRIMQPNPYNVSITATDGLSVLENVDFIDNSGTELPGTISSKSPLAFVRDVLYMEQHLNNPLPLRWISSVVNIPMSTQGFSGAVEWGAFDEAWNDFNGNYKSCMYVLRGMLECFQMRIFQCGGEWVIQRINDITNGEYPSLLMSYSDPITVTTEYDETNVEYPFINENQVMMIKPALTDCEVEYDYSQGENILPNGGFDVWGNLWPRYWRIVAHISAVTKFRSLSNRPGNSAELFISIFSSTDGVFSFEETLPFDSDILFKGILFGFTISPLEGFPIKEDKTIDWEAHPLKISVRFEADGQKWYLNEFGYWQDRPRGEGQGTYFVRRDWQGVGSLYTVWLVFDGSPNVGDKLVVWLNGQEYSHTVTLETENNLQLALGLLGQTIPPQMGGQPVHKWVDMVSETSWELGLMYSTSAGLANGDAYKSDALQEYEYIFPSIPNMKIDDIATVAFHGRGGNNEILMPSFFTPGVDKEVKDGKLKVEFYINRNQKYVLDDVYIRVEKNNDVYKSSLENIEKRTNSAQRSIAVSSSFSGFMWSNMMTRYYNSDSEYKFADSKYEGSLTGLTANAVMRVRHLPREVFQGDMYVLNDHWTFNSMYAIEGKKFLPLNSTYNIESGIMSLTAMEIEDGNPTLNELHYGSNSGVIPIEDRDPEPEL